MNSYVSLDRIKQLKNISNEDHISLPADSECYNYESTLKVDQKQIIIKENKENFRSSVDYFISEQAKESENHKLNSLELCLDKFLKNYIANLSREDSNHLYKIVDYYIDYIKIEIDEYFAKILSQEKEKSLYIVLKKLLLNFVLLPTPLSQDKFNRDMKNIFFHMEKNMENQSKKSWIFFNKFSYIDLLEIMRESNHYTISSQWIRLNWLSNYFTYKFVLWKEDKSALSYSDTLNKVVYSFSFYKIWKKWIYREEMIELLDSKYKKITDSIYFLDANQYIKIYLRVKNRIVDKSIDWETKEYFDIEFFVEEKEDLSTEEFLEYTIPLLEKSSSQNLKLFYTYFNDFPKIPNIINIETDILNMQSDWEKLMTDSYEWWDYKALEWKKIETINSFSKKSNLKLDDLIIWEKEKEELKILIDIFSDPEYYIKNWLELPKWTILYWPPWVWKTLFAKILADNTDAEIIIINHSDIQSKWVWESAINLKAKFNQARELVRKWKKVIILFDEWDSLLAKRWEETTHTEWMINVLLSEMDWFDETLSKNIFVLLLTNLIENIDPAVKRRFNKQIKFNLPTKENLKKILELNISKYNNELFLPNLNLDKITAKLDKKSGRFVKNLMYNSVLSYLYNKKNINPDLPPIWEDYIISMINFTEEKEAENNKKMWFRQ